MTNTIQYTPDVLQEAQKEIFRYTIGRRFYGLYAIGGACLILFFVFLGTFGPRRFETWLMLILAVILVAETLVIRKVQDRKMVRLNRERFQTLYGENEPTMVSEISDDGVELLNGSSHKKIDYKSVKRYFVTEHLIVLYLDGEMIVPLSKNGFDGGTLDDCLELLQTNVRPHK